MRSSPLRPEELADRAREFYATLPQLLAGESSRLDRARRYRAALADAGLSGPSYPTEYGGLGLTEAHQAAVDSVRLEHRLPEETVFGISLGMALPTIRDHGTDELCRRFIPPGLRGEEIWCQLYSEPSAGSDLAGLATRAVLDGDEWLVSGQKVWTSGAQHSDLAILLARTDPAAPKHAGITMFVLPMDQPGVDVRPLVQMTGVAEFNEVFLDEARIPRDWVIGEVNGGWSMAVALLAHERRSLGRGGTTDGDSKSKAGRSPLPFDGLAELATAQGQIGDPVTRQELAATYTGELLIRLNAQRRLHPSIGKLWRTIQGRRAAQLAHRLGGPRAAAWQLDDSDADYWAYHVLNCRGMSLGGGTDEIQKNTLGERVLGLPREPRVDPATPFDQLPRN